MQRGLFDMELIAGLRHWPELLAPAEQAALLDDLATLPFAPFEFQRWQGLRRVVSFGWRYDFQDARLQPAPPLPAFLQPLHRRAAALLSLPPATLEQVLVTEYRPGAGIGWHRDRPVFDAVVGISLGAPCILRFRRRAGARFERVSLPLAPGSAYALTGPARQDWEHSIAPLDALRYSITFRSLRAPSRRAERESG